jgi:hypothetical protein
MQRLLALQQASSTSPDGQNLPSDGGSAIASGSDGGAVHRRHHHGHHGGGFAGDTLSALLDVQKGPPSAQDVASSLVSAVDTNGDGQLSADEIGAAISGGGASTVSNDDLTSAIAKLDTNGDGQLSADELTAALKSAFAKMAQVRGWMDDTTASSTASVTA